LELVECYDAARGIAIHRVGRSAAISGSLSNLRACRTKHYRRAAFLRNIFRDLMASVNITDLPSAILPPRKKPDAAACVGSANCDAPVWPLVRRNDSASRPGALA
jgi:hypothetical protein